MLKASVLVSLLMCSVCSGFLIKDADLLMYFRAVTVSLTGPNTEADQVQRIEYANDSTVNYIVDTSEDKKTIQIALEFTKQPPSPIISTFQMNMTLTSNPNMYWSLANATATFRGSTADMSFDNVGLVSDIFLEAPLNQSFACSKFGRFRPDARAGIRNIIPNIEFIGLQVQAFTMNADGTFGEPWDCIGFFSIGIWSGIFISAILIAIITWGLAMIMDVKTMDRFDDPKGKPISFGGAE